MRQELTDASVSFNGKYFLLHEPVVIAATGDIPETTYTHLYIRKPDAFHPQVGDIDFYMGEKQYKKLKQSLAEGNVIPRARILPRTDIDYVELYDPHVDAMGYIGHQTMTETMRKINHS